MEELVLILRRINDMVWGPWMLGILMGTGIYLMIRMRFLPLRNLGYALRCAVGLESGSKQKGRKLRNQTEDKKISPFSALMTELATTIGIGNIVGVASAMILGGPGALVWMLLSSFLGLSTKLAESVLAVKYRTRNRIGEWTGGPMYTLQKGFPFKKAGHILGWMFAIFAVFASFGMGNMTQANSIAVSVENALGIAPATTGLVLTIMVILAVLGGIRSISKVALIMVPVMALLYLAGAVAVILSHLDQLQTGIGMILSMSFSIEAVAGGVGGNLVANMGQALRWGVSRGVFSHEAGLGAAGISAAAADTHDPVRQGYISMTSVFFDTMVVCTVTGLALAASGVLGMTDAQGELLIGTALTIAAFETTFGEWGGILVTVGIALFGLATIIGWAYQGEKAFEFIVKKPVYCVIYRFVYGFFCFVGAVCSLEAVWSFSDICNGLMALPNLICVLGLSKEVCRMIVQYGGTGSCD